MKYQTLNLTAQNLPVVLDIKMLDDVNKASLEDLKESLISQIEYNSRYDEGEGQENFKIEILGVQDDIVKVKIHSGLLQNLTKQAA